MYIKCTLNEVKPLVILEKKSQNIDLSGSNYLKVTS